MFLPHQPLLREAYEANPHMSEAEAKEQLERCLRILYYRDGRSWNKVSECSVLWRDRQEFLMLIVGRGIVSAIFYISLDTVIAGC